MIHFDHESVGGFMRGRFRDQGGLFSYLSPEARVPAKHPLRQGRGVVRAVLKDLSPSFGKLYSSAGRPLDPTGAIAERLAAPGVLRHPLGTPADGTARLYFFVSLVGGAWAGGPGGGHAGLD